MRKEVNIVKCPFKKETSYKIIDYGFPCDKLLIKKSEDIERFTECIGEECAAYENDKCNLCKGK